MPDNKDFSNFPNPEQLSEWLTSYLNGIDMVRIHDSEMKEEEEKVDLQKPPVLPSMEKLMALVGLENIKETVKRELSYHYIMNFRRRCGRRTPKRIPHLLLVGNPGCGKTTVARLIGKIYSEAGILENDVFIETNRAGLVGRYIGESEAQTTEFIAKAKGGILFIDEIYSLADSDGKETRDFGKKVIDTLIPVLSDPDSNVMIIGAGYPNEMKYFLKMNSGLASRFPLVLEFNDFSLEQLIDIAESQVAEYDFYFSENAREKFRLLMEKCRKIQYMGNARMVVTTIQSFIIPRLCMRMSSLDLSSINVEETSKILAEDIPSFEEVATCLRSDNTHKRVGF